MLEINGKTFSDDQVMAEFKKRTNEYRKWRQQKAAEFLKNKKRSKCYRCEVVSEEAEEEVYYLPLKDDILARVRALKEKIANASELKTDQDRADEFHDRIGEIGDDIQVDGIFPSTANFTNIDLENYIYLYRFDIHLFDWKGEKNGKRFPATVALTDEEYVELLAHLIDQPDCSFHHLAYLSPKLKAIYKKTNHELHETDFGFADFFCHNHDYAVLMTELREDANNLLKLLKKGEQYLYLDFLKNPSVNMIVLSEK